MTIKEKLKEYLWTVKNIECLECDLLVIESRLQSVVNAPGDGVSANRDPDKWTNLIDEKIKTEELINQELKNQYQKYREVQGLIASLPERERYLMQLRYIKGDRWENICVAMGYEWRQVHRIHAEALQMIDLP